MTAPTESTYTLRCTIEVEGYGTDKQAAAVAQRIRQTLNTTLHRFVRLPTVEVERRHDG